MPSYLIALTAYQIAGAFHDACLRNFVYSEGTPAQDDWYHRIPVARAREAQALATLIGIASR